MISQVISLNFQKHYVICLYAYMFLFSVAELRTHRTHHSFNPANFTTKSVRQEHVTYELVTKVDKTNKMYATVQRYDNITNGFPS